MKFTFEWLLSHIETDLSVEEISEKLTSLGIEVEEICDNSKKFDNFVIGFVRKLDRHPDADKLSLCEVDVGNNKFLNIVCGAKNVRADMKVVVALIGAIIPATGLPLKKGKIRGVESEGMMCSVSELMLAETIADNGGIIDVNAQIPEQGGVEPGVKLSDMLNMNDVIFDVGITPNRSDCFSVRGIARLLAAAGCGTMKPLMPSRGSVYSHKCNEVDVAVTTKDCPYFTCKVISNVDSFSHAPEFITKRLSAIGQKLIYAPVDVANYICLDIGQPMHIFDLDKIEDRKLVVRNAADGETLETLDGNNTTIATDSIVVSSKKEVLSIAGIMGGVSSSFSESTKNILIESAYFDRVAISLAGQKMRIHSDSRTRNERGIDPENVDIAMEYASFLISGIFPGCCVGMTQKYGSLPENKNKITVRFESFKNITGLSDEHWKLAPKILEGLGMIVEVLSSNSIDVLTPSFRHDLSIEEDIIEEILIMIGYDNIDNQELSKLDPILFDYVDERVSDVLVHNGYHEIKTLSFVDKKTAHMFEKKDEKSLELRDPLTNEFAFMRPSIVASHLKSIKVNQNKSQVNCKFFEIGKSFSISDNGKISEKNVLSIIITGKNNEKNWEKKESDVSIFDIKADIERVLMSIGVLNTKISNNIYDVVKYYHPGRSGGYTFKKNELIAYFGEIHPSVLKDFGIEGRVVCAEIFLDVVPKNIIDNIKKPIVLSSYQPITRDFSFVVRNDLPSQTLVNTVKKMNIGYMQNIEIFDVYKLDDEKKAIGIQIVFQSIKDTISDVEMQEISDKIIQKVEEECAGVLRG